MALIEVKVPQLSESVAEATLLSWHKKVGQAVKRDENLIDVETDKIVLELPAPEAGVISEIIKNDGATVVAGEIIARLKAINPAISVLARAHSEAEVKHLLAHGADAAVLAERELAYSLADMVMSTPPYRPARAPDPEPRPAG